MFHSTLPQGAPDLMRASDFRRYLAEGGAIPRPSNTPSRLGDLPESLMQDLLRFEHQGRHGELLEVLAACVRHTQNLAIHVHWTDFVLTLSVFPTQRLAYASVPLEQVLSGGLSTLQVLQVERATLRPPGDSETALVGDPTLYHPLHPVLWTIALRGPRETLLPEISGQAAYRVAPGLLLNRLDMPNAMAASISHLRRQTCNLREICALPGMDRGRAIRLLNALYLQAGLIVSRTHPAATNEGWFGYR
jgi:hypothetical protein